jgi:RNA polymerase sigma-70 factor (ECF subfamily)
MKEPLASTTTNPGTDTSSRDPSVWVDQHGDAMYRFAIIRVKDPGVAEDLIQETFLSAIKAIDKFRGSSSVRTWLIGILKRKIIDYFRKSTKEISESDLTLWEEEDDTRYFDKDGHWKRAVQEWKESPEELVVNQEFWTTFRACLSGLPEAHRRAFTLREIDGIESDEICKVLAITSSNLWVMLHRARSKLRKCLDATWFQRTSQETE